jgi:hypothetical protein
MPEKSIMMNLMFSLISSTNFLFLLIMIFTFAIKIFLLSFGVKAAKTFLLDMERNFICIGIESLSWGLIVKNLQLKMFQCIKLDETPMELEEQSLP